MGKPCWAQPSNCAKQIRKTVVHRISSIAGALTLFRTFGGSFRRQLWVYISVRCESVVACRVCVFNNPDTRGDVTSKIACIEIRK